VESQSVVSNHGLSLLDTNVKSRKGQPLIITIHEAMPEQAESGYLVRGGQRT